MDVDRVLALAPAATQVAALGGPAAVLWRALTEPLTARGATEAVAAAYGRDTASIGDEVLRALDELAAQGLVERSSARSGS